MRIHISLPVTSLANSLDFYRTLLGRPASKERPAYANFRLDEPPIHLALVEGKAEKATSASHYGVELPDHDTLAAWKSRLEKDGVSLDVEDDAQCCYAQGDKVWLSDPDGNRWEIWVRTGDYAAMGSDQANEPEPTRQCCSA